MPWAEQAADLCYWPEPFFPSVLPQLLSIRYMCASNTKIIDFSPGIPICRERAALI